jgi:hypothetical protein
MRFVTVCSLYRLQKASINSWGVSPSGMISGIDLSSMTVGLIGNLELNATKLREQKDGVELNLLQLGT